MQDQTTAVPSAPQLDLLGPREIRIHGADGQLRGIVLVDAQDYERIAKRKWHIVHSRTNTYARRYDGKTAHKFDRYVWMHREILDAGDFNGTVEIDHEDGNGLNNQRSNLIISDRKRNGQNRRKLQTNTSSKYRGVFWCKTAQRWVAHVKVNGKRHYFGRFTDEDEAGAAARAGRALLLPHSTN